MSDYAVNRIRKQSRRGTGHSPPLQGGPGVREQAIDGSSHLDFVPPGTSSRKPAIESWTLAEQLTCWLRRREAPRRANCRIREKVTKSLTHGIGIAKEGSIQKLRYPQLPAHAPAARPPYKCEQQACEEDTRECRGGVLGPCYAVRVHVREEYRPKN